MCNSGSSPVRMENMHGVTADSFTKAEDENETRQAKRLMPTFADAVEYFKLYCDATGIHGVRYLAEERRYFIEKLFWMAALVVCAIGCSLVIAKVKEKLDTTPVIVTFAESTTNIWNLPFPAVTICPLTKSRRTLFNFTKYANMIKGGEDLQDDYQKWVETMFAKMANTMYHENITKEEYTNYNTTWIKEEFQYKILPQLYGDTLSEELTSLFGHIFAAIKSDEKFFENKQTDNSTWMNQRLADFKKHFEGLRESIKGYYPTWRNEIYQQLRALYNVCSVEEDYWDPIFGVNSTSSYVIGEDTLRFLMKVAPELNSTEKHSYKEAYWDKRGTFDYYFKYKWTQEGLCYTFNMMDDSQIYSDQVINHRTFSNSSPFSEDWHPDTGYSTKAGRKTYPRRSKGVGKESGLLLFMSENSADIEYLCDETSSSGYMIILHRPEDQPQAEFNYAVTVPFFKNILISIKPSLMTTSPGLENYDPRKRQCYYSHEKKLEYFKFYTKNNCELECLTKVTLRECGCVAYYMPRNHSTKICGKGAAECMESAADSLDNREIDQDLKKQSEGEANSFSSTTTKTECDCLPSCVTISYDAEVTMVDINLKKLLESRLPGSFYTSEKEQSFTYVFIFYKDKHFLASRRSELYGQIDFLANCGGLLGLFSGFSIISLIEIFYFLTIRLWANLCRRWNTNKHSVQVHATVT